jgi:hypothetical protein
VNPEGVELLSTDSRSLAASLAPVLAEACEGRLGEIVWFKADWQRGGAATGTSTFNQPDGSTVNVVLKLPVVQRELTWIRRLQQDDDDQPVVPRLLASGEEVGGYDLAWVVIEHIPHGPLGLKWHDDHIARIADAAARFYALTKPYPADGEPKSFNWDGIIEESLESVKINPIDEQKRWAAALKNLKQNLEPIAQEWADRPANEWLHGDLHIANAMCRESIDSGPVCLIDLADVHVGHWLEDAIYLERQLWSRPERMKPLKPVKAIAAARKRLGLPVEDDYPRLAMIRRALLAAAAPKFIKSEGHPRHLEACLNWLEIALKDVA